MAKRLEEIQKEFQIQNVQNVKNVQKSVEKQKDRNKLSIASDVIFGVTIVMLIIGAIMYYQRTQVAIMLEEYTLLVSLMFLVLMMASFFLKILSQKRKKK